ncbi:sensor domain-containing diguanylate cyclase [Clostridium sp. DL1XJH146]
MNIITPSGMKWIKIVGRFIINNKGQIIKLNGVVQDITELKEKELKLEEELKIRKKNELNLNKLIDLRDSVLQISHAVTETNNIDELFNIILDRALKSIRNGQIGSVLVLDEEGNLNAVAYRGFKKRILEDFKIKLNQSFMYKSTKGNIKQTVVINNVEDMLDIVEESALDDDGNLYIRSSISAPIFVDNKLYGLLNLDSENINVFNEMDIEIMEYLRLQVSIAIEKHLLYEKTIQFSRYDELTGVYNRRYFEERLDIQLEKSKRYKEKFCLVIFDLDKFKEINDNYGHIIGDGVLRDFADRLTKNFRSSDIIGRFGGDEFVALIYNTDNISAKSKIEHIREELNEKVLFDQDILLSYNFSYGISSFVDNETDFNSLLKDADKKMYENKSRNRTRNR